MKKTIATIALTASPSAFALIGPGGETKTVCLNTYETAEGLLYAGSCDEAPNNEELGLEILENGCAEGQIALTARKFGETWEPQIASCLPPNVVQL